MTRWLFGIGLLAAAGTMAVPAAAVNAPPQLLLALAGFATTRPAGQLSVTPTPLKAAPRFGLLIVSVRLVVPPTGTLAAPNDSQWVGVPRGCIALSHLRVKE